MATVDGRIRVGTPQNIWGAESPNMPRSWLPGVPEQAFCILYLDPARDRKSVLTAIFTQDRLGYAEVALLLPDPNRALCGWWEFEAFSSLRKKLSTRLAIITWSPRLALLATWWHFQVAPTVIHYTAQYTQRAFPGLAQPRWGRSLLRTFWRYALVRWLGRAPG
jgi:hypothetical protein